MTAASFFSSGALAVNWVSSDNHLQSLTVVFGHVGSPTADGELEEFDWSLSTVCESDEFVNFRNSHLKSKAMPV
jgi:hypothetical protein